MSESAITEAEVSEDPWLKIDDDSTVQDRESFGKQVSELLAIGKRALSALRASETVTGTFARQAVQVRQLILYKGHPDWSAASATYREVVGKQLGIFYASMDSAEKRKLQASERQMVSRVYLEPAITDYCFRTVNLTDEQRKSLKWAEAKRDAGPTLAGDIPAPLKSAIAEEYRAAGLAVPEKFGGPARGGNTAGPQGGPATPAGGPAIVAMVEKVAPLQAIQDLLRGVVAFSTKVRAESEVTDRIEVEKYAVRGSIILSLTAKSLAGKITEKEIDTLNNALAEAAQVLAPNK